MISILHLHVYVCACGMHAFLFSLALNAASESQAEALSGGLKVDAISGEAMCGAAVDAISGQATSGAAPPQCKIFSLKCIPRRYLATKDFVIW